MTREQDRAHRRNTARLARQLAIAGDEGKPGWARKRAARHAAAIAERLGLIERPRGCQWCRARLPLERHHESYEEPLMIWWLCGPCHRIGDVLHGTAEHRPRRAS